MNQPETENRSDLQFSLLANELRSSSESSEERAEKVLVLKEKEARIVIYTEKGQLPTFIRVDFTTIDDFTNSITRAIDKSLSNLGKTYPLYIIKEIVDNFIFAQFSDVTVSIMNEGSLLRFSDHGDGIENKELCILPGFSTANSFHRKYIRATGSGLTIVSDYMDSIGGKLNIENNFSKGTVITLIFPETQKTVVNEKLSAHRGVTYSSEQLLTILNERQKEVLSMALHYDEIGPSIVNEILGIPITTAFRDLVVLENHGLIEEASLKKKRISNRGESFVKNELQGL